MANPMSSVRKEITSWKKINLKVIQVDQDIYNIEKSVNKMQLDENEDCEGGNDSGESDSKKAEVRIGEHILYLADGTIVCNICKKSYKMIGPMKKHLENNHEIVDAVIFKCKKCNSIFQ